MQVVRVRASNFRGIAKGEVFLDGHTVLVGDNNTGKSTLLEAIDLVLGPERLGRRPVVDEHDFYAGLYLDSKTKAVIPIQTEVVVSDLSLEQLRHFREHLEWWDKNRRQLLAGPPAEGTDAAGVALALRVFFNGWYDAEEDDFLGDTFYAVPELDDGAYARFTNSDKRRCGFLLLRTLRTGARALSLERGSLLDIILRLQDKRLKLWEDLLTNLRDLSVGEQEQIGALLASVQDAVRHYVPSDWAENPHMRVSDLTREMLRRTLTVFMGTGAVRPDGSNYAAPYQHQGTGTINTLVLSLLSIIAQLKQNVIFAMEEPEIAIPPHTQKRIISSLSQRSAQAIFTSHSPYVLEEFKPEQICVLTRTGGHLQSKVAGYPPSVKQKSYRAELRTRFCETLLAKYVLVVEGRTEFDALPAAAIRLHDLAPDDFKTLDNLGVAIIDAQGETNVAALGEFLRGLGKVVFAVFDKQPADRLKAIKQAVDYAYESPAKGIEDLILSQTSENALRAYALELVSGGEWPQHLAEKTPLEASPRADVQDALADYFGWKKGGGDIGDLLATCAAVDDMPQYVRDTLKAIAQVIEPPATAPMGDTDAPEGGVATMENPSEPVVWTAVIGAPSNEGASDTGHASGKKESPTQAASVAQALVQASAVEPTATAESTTNAQTSIQSTTVYPPFVPHPPSF
jgi:putative ATP-dependent endonuclease of the OLD family